MNVKRFRDNLYLQIEENPLLALGVATAGVAAVTKLIQANNERNNSKTWKKEVDRRIMFK